MENSYHHIAHQILKNERSKHYSIYLNDDEQDQEKFNNEQFLIIYDLLKDKYKVIFRLFGEQNFINIAFEYFKFNPIQSSSKTNYGKSFPDFLKSKEEFINYPYLFWLAKLDWFWTNSRNTNDEMNFPQGTLNSWANIYKNQGDLDIQINLNQKETLAIKKVGNEYSIVVK